MAGVGSVLSMGVGALNASQTAISVTGNNISNVNTVGYSRQSVVLREKTAVDSYAGQIGQGVQTQEVIRSFDRFIESSLVGKLGSATRYSTAYSVLSTAESVFNESMTVGISDAMMELFNSWNDLAQDSSSSAVREALLASATTLASTLRGADNTLAALQEELNGLIAQEVNTANQLIQEIAALNREINAHTIENRSNANSLMDQRDAKVRELAEIIDISIQDNGAGDYYVTTTSGNLLVQQDIGYSLLYQGPRAENSLTADSPYKSSAGSGMVGFSGTDTREYTIEVVNDGTVDGTAQFKVSLDGGKTWLREADGSVRLFDCNSEDGAVAVGDLTIWFDAGESLAAGDSFVISPKSDVYWVSPTSGPINISTQIYSDGTENSLRITGGSLGGYLGVRDYMLGDYRDQLDSLAKSIIWEVNRIHSQGAGLEPMTYALGAYAVSNTSAALGGDSSGLAWASNLSAGNVSFAIYDVATGEAVVPYPGMEVFSGVNFDPATHSLEDVASAINAASFIDADGNTVTPFSASIVNGKLELATSDPKYGFSVVSDTTGLAAALGINTFFTGDSAATMAVNGVLTSNTNLINAGRVNGAGEGNEGDNITAKEIAGLSSKAVTISTPGKADTTQTLASYYAALVARVGSDTAGTLTRANIESTQATNLLERQEEVAGVSLDEEMSNLIKFQASYKAAAKLITTADEMLQTILGLKQ